MQTVHQRRTGTQGARVQPVQADCHSHRHLPHSPQPARRLVPSSKDVKPAPKQQAISTRVKEDRLLLLLMVVLVVLVQEARARCGCRECTTLKEPLGCGLMLLRAYLCGRRNYPLRINVGG